MRKPIIAVSTLLAAMAALPAQEHWGQFRGPGSRGIAVGEQALPAAFGPSRNLIWKCPVDGGHSSPCIWGDRIFLTSHGDDVLATLCIDRASGRVLWRRELPVESMERLHRINSPSSPTPATDGERVYAYFGSFGLICYDLQGVEQWRRELPIHKNSFGTASSPMVAGEFLILSRDTNEESFLEAIHGRTGETAWKTDRTGFQSGWSTPVLWQSHGVDELLVYGAFRLTAYDLADGGERWSVPGLADEPCITPVTGGGLVFVSSYNMRTNPEVIGLPQFEELLKEYDRDESGTLDSEEVQPNKSILSRMDADGEGDHPLGGFFRFLDRDRDGELTDTEWQKMHSWLGSFKHANAVLAIRPGDGRDEAAEIVWQHPRGVPECPSPLYHEERIYLVKNGGLASCLDAATGAVKWQERLGSRGPCYASPVVGNGKIYAASARGVVTVFAVGDELEVLARNDLEERIMATPALLDGRIYLRTEQHLYAFGLPE